MGGGSLRPIRSNMKYSGVMTSTPHMAATRKTTLANFMAPIVLHCVIPYDLFGPLMASPLTLRLDSKTRQRLQRIPPPNHQSKSGGGRQTIHPCTDAQRTVNVPDEAFADLSALG